MRRNANKIEDEAFAICDPPILNQVNNLIETLEKYKCLYKKFAQKTRDNICIIREVLYKSVHNNKSNKVPEYKFFFKYQNNFCFAFNKT